MFLSHSLCSLNRVLKPSPSVPAKLQLSRRDGCTTRIYIITYTYKCIHIYTHKGRCLYVYVYLYIYVDNMKALGVTSMITVCFAFQIAVAAVLEGNPENQTKALCWGAEASRDLARAGRHSNLVLFWALCYTPICHNIQYMDLLMYILTKIFQEPLIRECSSTSYRESTYDIRNIP